MFLLRDKTHCMAGHLVHGSVTSGRTELSVRDSRPHIIGLLFDGARWTVPSQDLKQRANTHLCLMSSAHMAIHQPVAKLVVVHWYCH